jgi:hypothetical protein
MGGGAMFRTAWLKKKMPFQPAPLQNQLRGSRKLTDVFAQETERFVGKKPIARRLVVPVGPGLKHFACDAVLGIDRKQIRGETGEKIFRFPIRQGRADPQTGNRNPLAKRLTCGGESFLQPRFQFCLQIRLKQSSQHIALPLPDGWRLIALHQPKYMKTLLTFIAIAFLATIPVDAKTFKLPNEDFAIASIDMPDSWKPKEVENGIWGQSADTAVYMSVVAVGSEKGMTAEIEDTFEMLKTHNVNIDESTKKENKFKIGSLEANELLFQGKDEDGPCAISICFVPIKDKLIIFTYWVTTAKEKEHLAEVGKIVNSLKPTS